MDWMGVNELRERYLSFFEQRGHVRLPSAPLVPQEDQSLLLINSGMAPLKKYFLGLETPPGPRATSCQKCIRTPDIERVGKTSRHGTFFEMLGNFSFGDYFKEDATKWAWEFVTQEMGIPTEILWVSIFQDDDEAFDIWTKNRGVDPARIVRLGREDNFWEIGSGPCGPCSEIYVDRGERYGCGSETCGVGCDCDRYVEIWNLVFTQYNSDGSGNYTPLEHPNIDTGMGLERLACVMQGVDNLFEVDTMQAIMQHVCRFAGVAYKRDDKTDVSLRVITDHIRSTVMMVGDGVVPQNEGRGYVLRRLLRRAARHGKLLGIQDPFLHEVAATVIGENEQAYPALKENQDYIVKVIRLEEERFLRTIQQGMDMLQQLIDHVDSKTMDKGGPMISGEDAFRLYDTFGFPLDLTREIAQDRGLKVDEESFLRFMQQQRERARKAREEQGGVGWEEDVLSDVSIDDKFVGYHELTTATRVAQVIVDGALADSAGAGQQAVLVLEQTPFYAESGGQMGDTGVIRAGGGIFQVHDCKKSPTGHYLHIGEVLDGVFSTGDSVSAAVDKTRRQDIMRGHTATHLLQAALRQVLGDHVHQAGSMVSEHVCRFDFNHFSAVTPQQLTEVEALVNKWILEALPVTVSEMSMDEAKQKGAMALFGDKYGDTVRVCDIAGASVELCGGTHVDNTARIGLFKILRESSVAAGVRRVEGTTGRGVLDLIREQETLLHDTAEALKCTGPAELLPKARAAAAQIRDLHKQVEELDAKLAGSKVDTLIDNLQEIGPVRFGSAVLGSVGVDALKQAADKMKQRAPAMVGILVAMDNEKATLLVFAGGDAVKAGIHCGKVVKQVAELCGGSGGGRPDNAMGGASELSKVGEAVAAAPGILSAMLAEKGA